jgi:hypothetical protein
MKLTNCVKISGKRTITGSQKAPAKTNQVESHLVLGYLKKIILYVKVGKNLN